MNRWHRLLYVLTFVVLPGCGSTPYDAIDAGDDDGGSAPPPSRDASTSGGDGPSDAASDTASDAPVDGGDAALGDDGASESLDVSFAFVGCNRLQKADWDPKANPSSANLPQLQQTFADIATLPVTPKFFMLAGDLVLGLNTDTTVLKGQLDGWAHVYADDPSGLAKKTKLVPLVGNHEMLQKVAANNGAKLELQNSAADSIWTSWLAASGFDGLAGNGPTNAPPNADALQDDQSKLSYSFDDGDVHYVVLNTDTWTSTADPSSGSTQIGWIAIHWLEKDLAAAQAKPETRHIFVFGHKPIITPVVLTSPAGDDAINSAFTASLESLLDATPKVHGYLCAHAHQWDARKLPGTRGVWQIVAGNGGSTLESAWSAQGFYGFTVARVYTSGRVGITSWQRAVPNPYNQGPASAAVAQPEITIVP